MQVQQTVIVLTDTPLTLYHSEMGKINKLSVHHHQVYMLKHVLIRIPGTRFTYI